MSPSRTTRTARTTGVLVVTALALVLSGCGDDTPTPGDSSAPASTTASSPTPGTSSPAATTSSTTSPSGTASVPSGFSLSDVSSPTFPRMGGDIGSIGVVRVGHHPTFDRVVWEFPGKGRPTYRVHYVDKPLADGSGDVVPVAGDAYLEVMITLVGVPPENTPKPKNASAASLSGTVIAEATAIYGGFEGYGQAFVGVSGDQRPFKVSVLEKPTRLVVDVYSG